MQYTQKRRTEQQAGDYFAGHSHTLFSRNALQGSVGTVAPEHHENILAARVKCIRVLFGITTISIFKPKLRRDGLIKNFEFAFLYIF